MTLRDGLPAALICLLLPGLWGACSHSHEPLSSEGGGAPTSEMSSGGRELEAGGPSTGGQANGGSPSGGSAPGGTASGGDGRLGGGGKSPSSGGHSASGGTTADDQGWRLIWADEFDGELIDASRWEHEQDCWGGGNNELQCYVSESKNSFIEDGQLSIRAIKDFPSGPEGGGSGSDAIVQRDYSSARLRTKGKADFRYGRFVARLKLPAGQGTWPAFWMLPTDSVHGGWAASGEIDIMEAVNLNPDTTIHGTLHFGGAWPENQSSSSSVQPPWMPWQDFHEYGIEWEEGEIRWYVDGTRYATQTDWHTVGAPFPAPFNERFHFILNVAVGGSWPGPPSPETVFPAEMRVDFVRVYECSHDTATGRGCATP